MREYLTSIIDDTLNVFKKNSESGSGHVSILWCRSEPRTVPDEGVGSRQCKCSQ